MRVEIIQNLVPVLSADIVVGGSGGTSITFGDTMTGTGTPTNPVNVSNDILNNISNNTQAIEETASEILDIKAVIPATANSQNQLADQGFVNSSIQTATAYFRGDWATWADVPSDPALYPADATGNHTPITNDYMVVIADEKTNGGTWRYKYTGVWAEQGKDGWLEEYQVNETPFTAAQLAAINSGATSQAIASIANKQDKLNAGTGISINGATISADCLLLSGGTLTGDVAFGSNAAIGATYLDGLIVKRQILGSWKDLYYMSSSAISPSDDGNKDLGGSTTKWRRAYVSKLNNGADLIVPTEGGTIARTEDIDAIGGDGTAGQVLTKTADGVAWQDATGGGGASLPDQAGNAGKFLMTDGATASWANALENIAPEQYGSIVVGSGAIASTSARGAVVIGRNAGRAATGSGAVAIGDGAGNDTSAAYSVAIGAKAQAGDGTLSAIAIGVYAKALAKCAIQLGMKSNYSGYTNSDENTFKVGNANGNFEMMSADGTIPAERHATLPTIDGTYVLKLVIAGGVPTLQWVAE